VAPDRLPGLPKKETSLGRWLRGCLHGTRRPVDQQHPQVTIAPLADAVLVQPPQVSRPALMTQAELRAAAGCPTRPAASLAAEPMSTLDAELNDFGAQLAMLRGHAADRDG
jgi:hypothetical protein